MTLKMTVKELITNDIDIDVYDDVCEELAIAFCGPLELSDKGKEKFAEVLEYKVEIHLNEYTNSMNFAVVNVDSSNNKVWKRRLCKAKEFFESAAGYCADVDYKTWFKIEEE